MSIGVDVSGAGGLPGASRVGGFAWVVVGCLGFVAGTTHAL